MKLGIIYCSPEFIESKLFNDFIAVSGFKEHSRKLNSFEHRWELVGESPHFDELKEGEVPPLYEATIAKGVTGEVEKLFITKS